jgi:diguanylate cyclase (GGDEF)-like protein
MTNSNDPQWHMRQPPGAAVSNAAPERWMGELTRLLHELQDATAAASTLPPLVGAELDNQLVQVRLGIASSLFAALQCKHPAAAGHALRVALTGSAWSQVLGLPQAQRDIIEVAGLLHDVGIIGVPDHILHKPGVLESEEAAVMAGARRMTTDILRHSCASPLLLETIEYLPAWYDGKQGGHRLSGEELPLGSRLLAIVEAFDAMVTDHVFRPAMSFDAAIAELFRGAGAQFDPQLVQQFAEYQRKDYGALQHQVAGRWLQSLDPQQAHSYWQLNCVPSVAQSAGVEAIFPGKLLENMYDAVVFIDAGMRIIAWNHGAERLTGIPAASICRTPWQVDCLKMCDEKGSTVRANDCPVSCAIQTGVQSLRRLSICGRSGRPTAVDAHTIPVTNPDGTVLGAILLLHDASSETSLEQRCQNLYEKTRLDALTQVANRAEFDRVHAMFVEAHRQLRVPCSMFICDLDKFKLVNDTYGHQAGDDAIKSLAALLKTAVRPGDLVARYGGEEFVMLLADCDNATATRRADQIRKTLSQIPQPKLEGRSITASFGVTEIQPGDTPETMLRRADRALLTAKSRGRNCVEQLGSGGSDDEVEGAIAIKTSSEDALLERDLVTAVPIKMAVEKLRGFVADHAAKVISIDGNHVELQITDGQGGWMRRMYDRMITFTLDVQFEEERLQRDDTGNKEVMVRTRIQVSVRPRSNRDRRRQDVLQRAHTVLVSFRSYLMANDADSEENPGAFNRVKRSIGPMMPT